MNIHDSAVDELHTTDLNLRNTNMNVVKADDVKEILKWPMERFTEKSIEHLPKVSDFDLFIDIINRGGISHATTTWTDHFGRRGKCVQISQGNEAVYIDFFENGRIVGDKDYD